jgi:hypothetical protein
LKVDREILSGAEIRTAEATTEEIMTGRAAARFAGVQHGPVMKK